MAWYTEVLQPEELTKLDLALLALGDRLPLPDLVSIRASHP
jgi:hypothetical protein